jgi:hypothetical protein
MFIKILNKVLIFVIFIIIAFDMIYITYITIKLGNGNRSSKLHIVLQLESYLN